MLDNVAGLEIYAIIGIIIFFTFFIALIVWVIRMKKGKVDEYSQLPLATDEDDATSTADNEIDTDKSNNKEL